LEEDKNVRKVILEDKEGADDDDNDRNFPTIL
jgi:hypothetical protein